MNYSTIAIIAVCIVLYLTVVAQIVLCAIIAAICFALAVLGVCCFRLWKTQIRLERNQAGLIQEIVKMRTDFTDLTNNFYAAEDAAEEAAAEEYAASSYSSYSMEEDGSDDASSYNSDTEYRDQNTVFLDIDV